jgi:hypothetical protein
MEMEDLIARIRTKQRFSTDFLHLNDQVHELYDGVGATCCHRRAIV